MKITLSPQRSDDELTVEKRHDVLTINGSIFDFSSIPNGATLPASAVDCKYIVSAIERINGDLHLTLLLPIGPKPSKGAAFPPPLINPTDGLLELPA
ncbi:MAG: hypothetical protein ACYC4S_16755 [Rhodoferax sp.]